MFCYGIGYIIHQDFYGYILFLLTCLYYSDKEGKNDVDKNLSKNNILFANILFILVVLSCVLFRNGLQFSSEWGTSMPLLYGPYELPHSLAYQLILMYLLASIGYHKYNKKIFLILMAVFTLLIVWTGVRSAFLAFLIILMYEYINIKHRRNKLLIFFSLVVVGLYVLFFTDFIYNNPIVQKTVQALGQTSGITNGRTDFNSYLSRIYINDLSIVEKLFGVGIDKLRYYMSLRYTTALHAHNDIFNSLIGMGCVGFILYLKLFIGFSRVNKKWLRVFVPIFILAFTNGLFMYTSFTPSLVIFLVYYDTLEKV